MIYKRGKRWRVIVYAGRDPITGRKRQKCVSVAARAEAKQAEARLITEVGAGQHRGTSNRTVAELLDRWLEWRQSVRPISPTTVATKRGRPMAASEDRELQGRRPHRRAGWPGRRSRARPGCPASGRRSRHAPRRWSSARPRPP
jgi:Arm domain-containing DNA-binding protein